LPPCHSNNLRGHPKYQFTVFISSMAGSPPALAFFDSIRDELKAICPAGAKYVDRINTSSGITDLTDFFAQDNLSGSSSTTTATTAYGKSVRSPLECFKAAQANAAHSQEQGRGFGSGADLILSNEREWQEFHGGKTYGDPIVAFHRIVTRRLTKPGPHELKVWTGKGSMAMGDSNEISRDVPANENPEAYGLRVVSTYETLTHHRNPPPEVVPTCRGRLCR